MADITKKESSLVKINFDVMAFSSKIKDRITKHSKLSTPPLWTDLVKISSKITNF